MKQEIRQDGAPNGRDGRQRVLVVDDEPAIADLVSTTLKYEGFATATAGSGLAAVALAETFQPHAVVLDVMLGDIDGFEVLRRLRAAAIAAPVLFLTAADSTEDRVRGLTLGGDDYICKPFSLAELVARVRVVFRRSHPQAGQATLALAGLEMNLDTLQVTREGEAIELTPTEFKLLRYLLENPYRVLSKDQIIDRVWPYDFDGDANIVETYISYLRRKVDAREPKLIHTVRGFGYCLRPPR